MILVNEKVEHIRFGLGVVTEEKDNQIWVQFQNDESGIKGFIYPEAFEKFLKAENQTVQNNALEQLHIKQEQIQLDRNERERKAAELREEVKVAASVKKKTTRKKSSN